MSLEHILSNWLKEQEDAILKNYESSGMRASGKFASELKSSIEVTSTKITGSITGVSYGYYMDKGRGSTKNITAGNPTLFQIIKQWIENKGIVPRDGISKNSLAFLITRKIHRAGWKPKHIYPNGVISSVLSKNEVDKLLLTLLKYEKVKIKSDILNELNDFNR